MYVCVRDVCQGDNEGQVWCLKGTIIPLDGILTSAAGRLYHVCLSDADHKKYFGNIRRGPCNESFVISKSKFLECFEYKIVD